MHVFARRYLIAVILAVLWTGPAQAATSPFAHPALSYLLQVNGQTYRDFSPDLKRPPASLTKIMTALIVLEKCPVGDVVKVSRSASRETGSRIGLRKGERLTVRDLLAATLIASANDACRALAEHVAGSQAAFVALMNERAKRLNLANTRFTNVCGHDHVGHYSSAHDLAVLANLALANPLFAQIVSTRTMRIATVKGKHAFNLRNKNRLIGRYPGARGVKTGTTPLAGQCLVALAQRGDTKVLLVLMRARNRWRSAPAMLDAVFANSSTISREAKRGES